MKATPGGFRKGCSEAVFSKENTDQKKQEREIGVLKPMQKQSF